MKRRCASMLFVLLVSGCGTAQIRGAEWTSEEAMFFDDGIDVIDNISKLQGEWRFEAEQDLNARANLADVIAVVTIGSVQTNRTSDDLESKRIQVIIDSLMYGDVADNELHLISRQDALGYQLIQRYESLLKGQHLLFLRWYRSDTGVVPHFHLCPAKGEVLAETERLIDRRIDAERAAARQ